MRNIFRIALFLTMFLAAAACSKQEAQEQEWLAVTPNNLSGTWEMVSWRGEDLADGLYFHIELTRRDKQFTMYENFSGTANVANVKTGRYDIYEDDVINGIYDNSLYEYWSHSYTISQLSATGMVWTATDNPADIMVFVRTTALPTDL